MFKKIIHEIYETKMLKYFLQIKKIIYFLCIKMWHFLNLKLIFF